MKIDTKNLLSKIETGSNLTVPKRDYVVQGANDVPTSEIKLVCLTPVMPSTYLLSRRDAIYSQVYAYITKYLVPDLAKLEEIMTLGEIRRRFGAEKVLKVTDELQASLSGTKNTNTLNFMGRYTSEQTLYDRIQTLLRSAPSDDIIVELLFICMLYSFSSEQVLASSEEIILKHGFDNDLQFYLTLTDKFFDSVLDRWVEMADPVMHAKFVHEILLSAKPYLDQLINKHNTARYDGIRAFLPLISEYLVKTYLVNVIRDAQDVLYAYIGSSLIRIDMIREFVATLLKNNDMYVAQEWLSIGQLIDEAKDTFTNIKIYGGTLTAEIVQAFKEIEKTQQIFSLAAAMHDSRIETSDLSNLYPQEQKTFTKITSELRPTITTSIEKLLSRIHLIDTWVTDNDKVINVKTTMSLKDLGIQLITLDQLANAYIPPTVSYVTHRKDKDLSRVTKYLLRVDEVGYIRVKIENNSNLKHEQFTLSDIDQIIKRGDIDLSKMPSQPIHNLITTVNLRTLQEQIDELIIDMSTSFEIGEVFPNLIEANLPNSQREVSKETKAALENARMYYNLLKYIGDQNIQHIKLDLQSEIKVNARIENDLLMMSGGIKLSEKTGELLYPIRINKEDFEKYDISTTVLIGQKQDANAVIAYVPSCFLANMDYKNLLDIDTLRVGISKSVEEQGMINKAEAINVKRLGNVSSSGDKIVWANFKKEELIAHLADGVMDIRPFRNSKKKWTVTLMSDEEYWRKQALRNMISLITNLKDKELAHQSMLYLNSIFHLIKQISELKLVSGRIFGDTLAPMFDNYLRVGWLSTQWRDRRSICQAYISDFSVSADALAKIVLFAILLEAYGYVGALGGVDKDMSFRDESVMLGFRFTKNVVDKLLPKNRSFTIQNFFTTIWEDKSFKDYVRDEAGTDLTKFLHQSPLMSEDGQTDNTPPNNQ